VRLLLVLIALILILPYVIPLPPVGVAASTLADADGRFISVNGLETYIIEYGDADDPPVLLLHGWGGSTFTWRDTIPALEAAGYRVIAFDRPPYGLSVKTGELPLGLTAQAEFTAALMDEIGIERAAVVGHSMGGGVIAYFAQLYPERVERLVFVDGAVRISEDGTGNRWSALGSLSQFQPIDWWARVIARAFVRPDSFGGMQRTAYYQQEIVTDEVVAGYGRQLQVENWDVPLLRVLTPTFSSDVPLTPTDIEAIIMPSLIMWGAHDTWVPMEVGERVRDLLPNDQWITYTESGHMPMEEQPDQFNADLIAFLGE
jgi:pimeloyl-ACP methyl ester carboxylesterase